MRSNANKTQAAQDVTRRAIRAERSRAKKQLEGALKDFEDRRRQLVAKGEEAVEGWKKERCVKVRGNLCCPGSGGHQRSIMCTAALGKRVFVQ